MFPAPASGQPRPHAAAPQPEVSHPTSGKFPAPHPGSASVGFGTGLYAAPFRRRPGIRRCKARPSHTQCFLRLHPGSLAPMRQRPGLRFPIPHLESFPPHIRAALACPLSVDRDGFLSLSLSLTEGNAPPFGPIRGRQRNPPKHCPRPRCPLPGSPFSSRVPPRQAARAGLPVSEDIFRAYPRHAAKLMRNAGLGAEASPQAGGRGSAPSTITASAGRTPQKRGKGSAPSARTASDWASPTETRQRQQHLAAIFRGWRTQTGGRGQIMPNEAAQRIPLRYAAKAAISAGHPPVIGIPPRHAAPVAHVLT